MSRRLQTLILATVMAAVTITYLGLRTPTVVATDPGKGAPALREATGSMGNVAELLSSLPDDYDTLVTNGNLFMDRGNYPVAAECYRRALILDEAASDVRVDFGACLHGMGLPHRAQEEFLKVLGADPEHAIAHFNLGIVLLDMQQADSARTCWRKYLILEPNGAAADRARELIRQTDR